jgi:hypothetical protein
MEVSIMKTFFLQLLCFWLSVSAYAQVECTLTPVSREERMKLPYYGNNDTLYRILENLKTPANVSHQRMSEAGYQIPVRFYVHRRTDGTGQASVIENGARPDNWLKLANEILASTDCEVRFYRACASVQFIDNDNLWQIDNANEADLIFDNPPYMFGVFNVHIVESAYFHGLAPLFLFADAIRPHNQTIIALNNRGDEEIARTLIHEFGHSTGLLHPHQGVTNELNRDESPLNQEYVSRSKKLGLWYSWLINGDCLGDTPADPGLSTTVSCNYFSNDVPTDHDGVVWQPQINNLMSWHGSCRNHLTELQKAVMYAGIMNFHSKYIAFANLIDDFETDNSALSATIINPLLFERQHHTIHAKCDEDWVRFEVGYFRKMVIETRAPFGMSDPSRYADTQIELYSRDAAGNPVLITSDDNSGTGNFSKIEMFLPAGTYFVRVTDQTPNLTLPLHYLIGVFNEFALWGDESAGGAGNSAS